MAERLTPDVSNYLAKDRAIKEAGTPISEKLALPRKENLPKELVAVAEAIGDISGTWNPVEIFTADNSSIEAEKAKFLSAFDTGASYNPDFTYSYAQNLDFADSRKKLHEQLKKLQNFGKQTIETRTKRGGKQTLERIPRLFRAALYFKIKDDLATCDLVDGIKTKNEKLISKAFKTKYPGTDQAILEAATSIYNKMLTGESDKVDPIAENNYPLSAEEQRFLKNKEFADKDIAKAFEWALDQYGILRSEHNPKGFQVIVSKDATSIDVRDKSKEGPTVFIPEGRRDSADDVLGLMAHEIEGHARQSTNGERTFLVGGGNLKVDNEMLYEGLGKRYDERYGKKFFGSSSGEPLPYFTFAVATAENGGSFYEIFSQQMDLRIHAKLKLSLENPIPDRKHIDPKILDSVKQTAWQTTYRVMRGHIDTSNKQKFAMAKDLSYLRGWLVDKQLDSNGLGFLNEEGVIASGGLQLLAELKLSEDQLPLPFKDVTSKYWEEILKPQMPEAA